MEWAIRKNMMMMLMGYAKTRTLVYLLGCRCNQTREREWERGRWNKKRKVFCTRSGVMRALFQEDSLVFLFILSCSLKIQCLVSSSFTILHNSHIRMLCVCDVGWYSYFSFERKRLESLSNYSGFYVCFVLCNRHSESAWRLSESTPSKRTCKMVG